MKKIYFEWTNEGNTTRDMKKKRKRRTEDCVDDDEDSDSYWNNMNMSLLSMSDFDYNTYANGGQRAEGSLTAQKAKISREDKRLQYYLGMIQRQERAEIKRKQRKERREHPSTKKVHKNTKNARTVSKPQFNEIVKLDIVRGPDKELDNLEKILKQSIWRESQLYSVGIINNEGLWEAKNNYKDDINSWNQSEDLNESTFDRLRTPTQKPYTIASIMGLGDDSNGFDNFSNKGWTNEELCLEDQQNLKDNYCSQLLKLTRHKQNSIIKAQEDIQALNTTTNKLNMLNEGLVIKPIFNVIRSKREQYKLIGKIQASIESTQSSECINKDSQLFKVPGLPYKEEAVMLIS